MKITPYVLDLVSIAGLRIVDVKMTGGTHIKARLQREDGFTANFIFANSPSEKRGFHNKLADLRRFARGEYNPITPRSKP